MKKDLFTYGLLAIIGVVAAYFVCNLFLPEFPETSFKVLTSNPSYTLSAPDPEIFNFRAINPTIEVPVNCADYGTCDDVSDSDTNGTEDDFMDYYFSLDGGDSLFEVETFEEEIDDGNPN